MLLLYFYFIIIGMKTYPSVAAYMKAQAKDVQPQIRTMYDIVRAAAPKASEAIKYGMPTLVGKGNLVHFAAMKGHLGFYPTSSAITAFAAELTSYSTSKGCVRFPYDKPLPKRLITKMVKYRVKEDLGAN